MPLSFLSFLAHRYGMDRTWSTLWRLVAGLWCLCGLVGAGLADEEGRGGNPQASPFKVAPDQVAVKRVSGTLRAPGDEAFRGDDETVGGFTVDVDVHAPVPRRVAYAVLSDFSRMATFVPNVEKSEILTREGNRLRVLQHGRMRYGLFSIGYESVRDVELLPDRILAKGVSGSARHMESELRFDASPGERETRFHYHAWIVPEIGLPPLVGPAAVRHEVAEQFTAMVQEMVRRLAASP